MKLLMAVTVLVGAFGIGRGAAWVWRKMTPSPSVLTECALGVLGIVWMASAATLALSYGFTGRWMSSVRDGSLADPFFLAAMLGTMAGHLALLGWAWGTAAPLALTRANARWFLGAAGIGVLAVVCSIAWGALVEGLGFQVVRQDVVATVLSSPAGMGRDGIVAFIIVGAPLLEELVFRGFLQTAIAARVGAPAAAAVSAVSFGFFHLADPPVVPVLIVIGGMLAWLRMRSGSVLPAIVAHAVNNSIALALAILSG